MVLFYLAQSTARYISVDEILYWAGAILTIIALASAIIIPLRKMLNRYNEELKASNKFIEEQTKLNERYQALLTESKEERKKLNADISAIKKATLTQIKLEINKICDRANERGFVYAWEAEIVETLFEAYEPLGGNSNTKSKVIRMRVLKVSYDKREEEYERCL